MQSFLSLVIPCFIIYSLKFMVFENMNRSYLSILDFKKIRLNHFCPLTGSCKVSVSMNFKIYPSCWNMKISDFNKGMSFGIRIQCLQLFWQLDSCRGKHCITRVMPSQYRIQAIKISFVISKTWNQLKEN